MSCPAPRSRRTPLLVLLALLAPFLGVVVTAGPAGAADGDVAWAVRTASNSYGDDRQNYSYTLNPGGTLSDALVVVNHGAEPITLAVSAADGFTTDGGQLDLLTSDVESTGVGAWVVPDRTQVTIQPEKTAQVPFTLTLPDNATPGDYLGGVITSLTQPGAAGGLDVDRRLALRVRLRVGGELTPSLAVENLTVDYAGTANPAGTGSATVSYTIHNTGNAILAAGQAVSVAGPFGTFRVDAAALDPTPELLPGETWDVAVPVDGLRPAVRLTADVELTPLLTDASGSVAQLDPVETTARAWSVPWTLLLLVVVLVGLGVLRLVVVRRRRAAARRREDERVQAAVADALAATTPAS